MSRSFQPASYSAIQSIYSAIPSGQAYGDKGGGGNAQSVKYYVVNDILYVVDSSQQRAKKLLSKGLPPKTPESDYNAVVQLTKNSSPISQAVAAQMVSAAQKVAEQAAAPAAGTLNSKLLAGKWTDGKYTYEINASGEIKIGSKSYPTSDAKYAALATNLNNDFSAGKLTSGSAPKKSYTAPAEVYTPPATTDQAASGLQESPSIMEAWWFWPAIGVGTLAVGGGVYFAFLRGK
jgi:uncharacterized protein (DUF2147 family)